MMEIERLSRLSWLDIVCAFFVVALLHWAGIGPVVLIDLGTWKD